MDSVSLKDTQIVRLDIMQFVRGGTVLKNRKLIQSEDVSFYEYQLILNSNILILMKGIETVPSVKVKFSITISGGYTANKKAPINPAAGFNK